VLNSLSGEQVQEYVDKGYYQSNLDHRIDNFLQRSSGTQIIIDNDDIRNNDDDSDSVSININDNYACHLESDNSNS
jgi:hypothetical protein